MINPGGSILWWWSAVDSHYTALLNITVTLLNTDSHDCSLHLHAVSVNTLLLIKLQKMVQFPGRMKPLLSTSVCRQQLWEETRRTDIRRGAPSIIYANIVNRNKLKNHFLCHAFLSNFLPPPRFLSFFPSVILSPSLNTSFSLPQDCALALTAHRVCCVYIPSFSSLTSLSLSLSARWWTAHWAIWTTTAFQALSLSKSCSVPLDACCRREQNRKKGGRREIRYGRGKVTETLRWMMHEGWAA